MSNPINSASNFEAQVTTYLPPDGLFFWLWSRRDCDIGKVARVLLWTVQEDDCRRCGWWNDCDTGTEVRNLSHLFLYPRY